VVHEEAANCGAPYAVQKRLIGANGRCSIEYLDGGARCFVSSVRF
jgi:hypothetical protein